MKPVWASTERQARSWRWRAGFSLVELLVVISIIALLIAILLPSLKRAREQAKIAVCLSHASAINKAMISYIIEMDAAPIYVNWNAQGTHFGFASWSFGGWSGTNRAHYLSWKDGKYYIPTQRRALSRYMYHYTTLREETETLEYYCPSDSRSKQGGQWPPPNITSYFDIGTSFHINWFFFELSLAGSTVEGWEKEIDRGQDMWRRFMQRDAARFVTLVEDGADWALNRPSHRRIQVVGDHKQFSRHTMTFLDGHAAYMFADTSSETGSGHDWTLMDQIAMDQIAAAQ